MTRKADPDVGGYWASMKVRMHSDGEPVQKTEYQSYHQLCPADVAIIADLCRSGFCNQRSDPLRELNQLPLLLNFDIALGLTSSSFCQTPYFFQFHQLDSLEVMPEPHSACVTDISWKLYDKIGEHTFGEFHSNDNAPYTVTNNDRSPERSGGEYGKCRA